MCASTSSMRTPRRASARSSISVAPCSCCSPSSRRSPGSRCPTWRAPGRSSSARARQAACPWSSCSRPSSRPSRCCSACRASRRPSTPGGCWRRPGPAANRAVETPMGLPELLAVLLVAAVCALLMAGYPVALTLGGVALAFAFIGDATGAMRLSLLGALPPRVFGVMTNEVLLAIPLFVFMGVMLERSRIAEDLLETMGRLFGRLTGGLAISVTVVGVLLAAAKGVVGATVVTMGLITLPAMVRHRYDPRLAAGTVAATATLAQIMPPATVLVLLGDQLNTAYQAAQLAEGKFAPDQVSVSDLFAGAVAPALALVGLYLLFQIAIAVLRPEACPAIPPDPQAPTGWAMARRLAEVLVAPVALIVVVLGSILGGLATPTEAAAVGAFGAILLTARKVERSRPAMLAMLAVFAVLALRALVDLRVGRADGGVATTAAIGVAFALLAVAAYGTFAAVAAIRRANILAPVLAATTHVTA